MRKKHFIGFVLLVLIINFLLPLTQSYQVFGDEKETISEKIIDTPELKINYVSSETNENINWKFNYSYQKTANTKQKLKLELIADGKSIPFQSVDGWNYENTWFVQDEFSEIATGTVELVTELSVTNVMLRIQADELSETETIATDIFTSEIEGPHQLRLPVVNPKNEIPVESTTIESSELEMTNKQQEEVVTDDKSNQPASSSSEQESLYSTEPVQTTMSSEKESSEENLNADSDTFEPSGNFSTASLLDSLTNYPAINPEYTTDENGTYPKHYWNPTNNQTVRNHQGKKFGASGWDGNNSWNGNSNNVTNSYIEYGGTGQDADFAIRKYAKETSTPGLYDVYLNVRGNQKENIKPVDIVLVVDMSGSMESDRAGAVRAGVKEFFQLINQAGIGDYVNVGFVGYSSPGRGYIDLIQRPIKPVSNTQHVTNINNDLDQEFKGGTFTQNGIEKGNELLLSSTNSNKMMILLTDGVPTFSKRVTQAITENGTVYGTRFHNSHQDQPGDTSGLQRGKNNYRSDYTAGIPSNRDPNIIPPNSDYEYYGRYYDTTNGIRIWKTWAATLGAAKIAKDSGSILHTLGIQLGADRNYLTEAQVRARASLLASPGLYRAAETTAEVTDYL
ncbi:MAG TPA: vWA domain-containing protein [Enterococcus sp.]|nr:vWA domain-containing protein [Enterococcus sp.]